MKGILVPYAIFKKKRKKRGILKKEKKEEGEKATQGPTVIVDLRESSDSINLYHN